MPHSVPSTLSDTGEERLLPPTPSGRGVDPNVHYSVDDFVGDYRSLVAAIHPELEDCPAAVERLDGRILILHTRLLREAARTGGGCAGPFFERYGRVSDESHRLRFRMVLDFLDERRAEVSRSGLGDDQEPMSVREDLVHYLLSLPVDPSRPRIPGSALVRFLDEWSTRWI